MKRLLNMAALTALALFGFGRAFGQDLSIQGDTKIVKVDRVIVVKEDKTVVSSLPFTVQAPKDMGLYFWSLPSGVIAQDMGDTIKVTIAPKGECTISVKMLTADFEAKKFVTKFASISFVVGDVIPPTPVPPGPAPVPEPPVPVPVKTFRVLLIHESAKTLTKEQNSVIYGRLVLDWLRQNTTAGAGFAGYRIVDPNQDLSTDPNSEMASLWNAVKAKVTTVPCIAIEVNGHAEILPLPINPGDAIAIFNKYKAGGK